jgi:ABC-type nitrate/sulfonate/bicarbonate transport system substrate-binding protein
MMLSRPGRAARLTAVAAAASLALAACASGDDAPAEGEGLGDLTVQLSWIKNAEFAGEFMADSKGYYADAGFGEVTLNAGPGATENLVASGKADFGLTNAVTVGQVVANEDAPIKIVGTTFQKNPFTILSLKDGADIATIEDLKGKKIGVQDGGNGLLFSALLAANGLTEDDVEIVPVQYDPQPLVNGEVDGFLAYVTNESIIVEAQGEEVTNLLFADNGLPFVAETITVTDDAIANNREALKAFLVAEIKGWTMAVNDPEAGAKLAVEDYGKDLDLNLENSIAGATEQAEALVVSDETAENGLFTISDALQEATIKSLAGAGITLEASDLFDLSLLAEVYEENPDLIAYAG